MQTITQTMMRADGTIVQCSRVQQDELEEEEEVEYDQDGDDNNVALVIFQFTILQANHFWKKLVSLEAK